MKPLLYIHIPMNHIKAEPSVCIIYVYDLNQAV